MIIKLFSKMTTVRIPQVKKLWIITIPVSRRYREADGVLWEKGF